MCRYKVRSFALIAVLCLGLPISRAVSPQRDRSLAEKLQHGPGDINHPVGVVPSAAVDVPEGWPLGGNGEITCSTCHTKLPAFDGSRGPQLRGPSSAQANPQAFCGNCHQEGSSRSAAGMHWLAIDRSHIKIDEARLSSENRSLDHASAGCLGCHDGVTAREANYEMMQGTSTGSYDPRRNHPIGVAYPHAGSRTGSALLRPVRMLPASIQLPGGSVSCVSCHNLYNPRPARLSVPIEGSRLCFSCHAMD